MGVIISYVRGSNEPDPVTGLTPREKCSVMSTWNLVKRDMTGNGVQLFMMFFRRKPEYQNLFVFRDVPYEELPKSIKLRAHGVSVMYAMAALIENLDNSEVLVTLLQKIGETHAKRNIPDGAFQVLQETFLELLEKGLGPKINKEGLDAWKKTLTVAFKVIEDSLKAAVRTA